MSKKVDKLAAIISDGMHAAFCPVSGDVQGAIERVAKRAYRLGVRQNSAELKHHRMVMEHTRRIGGAIVPRIENVICPECGTTNEVRYSLGYLSPQKPPERVVCSNCHHVAVPLGFLSATLKA